MKFYCAMAMALISLPIFAHTQVELKNKNQAAIGKPATKTIIRPEARLTGSSRLSDLQEQVMSRTSRPTQIKLDAASIERSRIKSWEITPRNMFPSGMDFFFSGQFTADYLVLKPRPSNIYSNNRVPEGKLMYYSYSGFMSARLQANKDYRLTIEFAEPLQQLSSSERSKILHVALNQGGYSIPVTNGSTKAVLLFTNTDAGVQGISLGLMYINEDMSNPYEYKVKKITLEELAPAS